MILKIDILSNKDNTKNIACKAAVCPQDKLFTFRWEFMPINSKRLKTALYFISDDYT